MSHTNHRSGSAESLKNEFVIIVTAAKDINRDGAGPKYGKMTKLFYKNNYVNGNIINWTGPKITMNTPQEVLDTIPDHVGTHAVFTSEEDLIGFLKDAKEEDCGVCITVSGIFDHVHECCRKAGLEPHTVNTSLGVHGNISRLPEERVLEIATMCGHGMVSFNLINDCVDKIKKGKMTPEKAAEKLTPLCQCGIFNTERAVRILNELSKD